MLLEAAICLAQQTEEAKLIGLTSNTCLPPAVSLAKFLHSMCMHPIMTGCDKVLMIFSQLATAVGRSLALSCWCG